MKKVHIAMVGETTENVVYGIMKVGGDELYPIVSETFQESSIPILKKELKVVTVNKDINGRPLTVHPFTNDAFYQIIGLIIDIVKQRKDDDIWINITGGTNLMSAAAATGAMLTGSKAYYVSGKVGDSQASIIKLPLMMMSEKVTKNRIRRQIIKELSHSNRPLANDEISRIIGESKKQISKNAIFLEKRGFLVREREGRHVFNQLTDNGKIAIKLLNWND